MWALANSQSKDEVQKMMQTNLAGEMSARSILRE